MGQALYFFGLIYGIDESIEDNIERNQYGHVLLAGREPNRKLAFTFFCRVPDCISGMSLLNVSKLTVSPRRILWTKN